MGVTDSGGAQHGRDEAAAANERHWERMVREGCGFTRPWLDLDREQLRRFVRGELEPVPMPLLEIYPVQLLAGVEGRPVLCLASGGGQQSAVFGLLGAQVTVVDLSEGQLAGDRAAAAHYGYPLTNIHADMRDLSDLPAGTFALVYQAESTSYVPDVRPVYAEVWRVLRPGGLYRVSFSNPATQFGSWESWDGEGYRLTKPYTQKVEHDGSSLQYRHYMAEIFDGLVETGFAIRQVQDDPQYFSQAYAQAEPGSWEHWLTYMGGFAVVASKG